MSKGRNMRFAFCAFVLSVISLTFSSCSDELTGEFKGPDFSDGLTILLPNITDYSTRTLYGVENDEGKINTLHAYFFDTDGKLKKHFDLSNSLVTVSDDGLYKKYSGISIIPGNYKIILTANIDSYLGTPLNHNNIDKNSLEATLLTFNADQPIKRNNLPMAALEIDIEGNENGIFKVTEDTKEIKVSLSFLCAKVRYTILFNSTEEGISKDFTSAPEIKSTYVSKLIKETRLNYDDVITEQIKGTDGKLSGWSLSMAKYSYPESGDNYPGKTEDTPEGNLSQEWLEDNEKIAWQGIIYIPENRNTDALSEINVSASIEGADATKVITIGEENNGIERGYMYDITTLMETPWTWSTTVSSYNWTEMSLPVDMVHTYLTLEKTSGITVTSNRDAQLKYSTDGRGKVTVASFGEDGKVDGKPIIIGEQGKSDEGEDVLIIQVNNEISLNSWPENKAKTGKGINCYVTAGNIRKLITVSYDIEPYFQITPETLTFNWTDIVGDALPVQTFAYETNLGGLKLFEADAEGNKGKEITSNLQEGYNQTVKVPYLTKNDRGQNETIEKESTITLQCGNPQHFEGEITVTSSSDPGVVAHHYFLAEATNQYNNETYSEIITVSVIPGQKDYRVYFRAINDYMRDLGGSPGKADQFLFGNYSMFPKESNAVYDSKSSSDKDSNWKDWWNMNADRTEVYDCINPPQHHLYIYGQDGETSSGFKYYFWEFNKYNVNPVEMNGDYKNPGWYFYDVSANAQPINSEFSERITPGRTLFIFNAQAKAEELHRCSHHNDPGVPLFNYEDREGWYLYDPTREPYYTVYDDKPIIEDVVYTVYTEKPVEQWYREYGVAEQSDSYSNPAKYKIYYDFGDVATDGGSDDANMGKCINNGDGWYKTTFKLKAPKGDYSKSIRLKLKGDQAENVTEEVEIENYVCLRVVDYWWDFSTKNLDAIPLAYFLNDQGEPIDNTNDGILMTKFIENTNSYYTYWVEIPELAHYVIFKSSIDPKITSPLSGGNINDDYNAFELDKYYGKLCYTTSKNRNNSLWYEYTPPYQPKKTVVTNKIEETVLFGGGVMPNNTGYYKNGKWTASKP